MNQCTCGHPHYHRKARVRKKRRIGEFAEMGFNGECKLADWRTGEENEGTLDEFLRLIESRGLHCGGGCGGHWDLFVCANGRCSATEERGGVPLNAARRIERGDRSTGRCVALA